jgi:hypothetical protein
LLISKRWYQLLEERIVTRASTGPYLAMPLASISLIFPCCWASRSWFIAAVSSLVARSRSAIASSRSSLASTVSPNQPKRSRNGFRTRLAPSWIGESAASAPRCTECRRPSCDSP